MKMRVFSAAFAVLLASSSCGINFNSAPEDGFPIDEPIDTRASNVETKIDLIDLTDIRTIRVEIPRGRVAIVQQGDGLQGTLEVTEVITKWELNSDNLARFLSGTEVSAGRSFVDDSRLDVEATLASDLADQDVVFDVRLVVPISANVEIVSGSGPVEVTNLEGNVEIHTTEGSIGLVNIDGNVIAESTKYAVSVKDTTGNVRAITTESDVDLRLAPGTNGQVFAQTTTGDINITLDKKTAANLDLSSVEGPVTANLGGFTVSDITSGKGYLTGVLNGGGGMIEAKSETGEIVFVGM